MSVVIMISTMIAIIILEKELSVKIKSTVGEEKTADFRV